MEPHILLRSVPKQHMVLIAAIHRHQIVLRLLRRRSSRRSSLRSSLRISLLLCSVLLVHLVAVIVVVTVTITAERVVDRVVAVQETQLDMFLRRVQRTAITVLPVFHNLLVH